MEDREREKELLRDVAHAGDKARVLLMTDREEAMGYAAVELAGNVLRILKLHAERYDPAQKPTGDAVFILDALMRAAASYGETFGADAIETAFPDFFDFFRLRGFQTDETHAYTPMSTVVHYE